MLQIPHCIEILKSTAEISRSLDALFSQRTAEFKALQTQLTQNKILKDTRPEDTDITTQYIQLVMLVCLSMAGGIFVTLLTQFKVHKNSIELTWSDYKKSRFTLGQNDNNFKLFINNFKIKMLGEDKPSQIINKYDIIKMHRIIKGNIELLQKVQKTILKLHIDKQNLKNIFSGQVEIELIFILLSALPDNDINAFFMHMHSFLPDTLEIKHPDGHKINVSKLFQSPSSDVTYLLTKLQIFLTLYESSRLPIIQEITHTKSKSFFEKTLQNDATYTTLSKNLDSLNEIQVASRMNIYTLFDAHLTALLK